MFKDVLSQRCNKMNLLGHDPELKYLQGDPQKPMEFLKLISCHSDKK